MTFFPCSVKSIGLLRINLEDTTLLGFATVSIDLLIKSLLAMGATKERITKAIAC